MSSWRSLRRSTLGRKRGRRGRRSSVGQAVLRSRPCRKVLQPRSPRLIQGTERRSRRRDRAGRAPFKGGGEIWAVSARGKPQGGVAPEPPELNGVLARLSAVAGDALGLRLGGGGPLRHVPAPGRRRRGRCEGSLSSVAGVFWRAAAGVRPRLQISRRAFCRVWASFASTSRLTLAAFGRDAQAGRGAGVRSQQKALHRRNSPAEDISVPSAASPRTRP